MRANGDVIIRAESACGRDYSGTRRAEDRLPIPPVTLRVAVTLQRTDVNVITLVCGRLAPTTPLVGNQRTARVAQPDAIIRPLLELPQRTLHQTDRGWLQKTASSSRVVSRTPVPPRKGTMHRIVDSRCVLAVRDCKHPRGFMLTYSDFAGISTIVRMAGVFCRGMRSNHAWRMCWRKASKRAGGPLVRGVSDRRGRRSVSCGSRRARSRGVVPSCDRTLGPAGVQHPHTGRASHPLRRTDRRCRLTAIGAGGGTGLYVLRWAAARPPRLNRVSRDNAEV